MISSTTRKHNHLRNLFVITVIVTMTIFPWARMSLADPVSYQLTGIGSGILGTTSFTDISFEIIGTGDSTGLFQVSTQISGNLLQGVSVDLQGIGIANASNPMYFADNQTLQAAGFLDSTTGDAFDFAADQFTSYDGVSALGPLAVQVFYLAPFDTTLGSLEFTAASDLSFVAGPTASPVPEPSGLLLAGLGMAGLWYFRKKMLRG